MAFDLYRRGASGKIFVAIAALDQAARLLHRVVGQCRAVGPHIGDEPDRFPADLDPFIQLLRRAHRLAGRHAKAARRLHLQARGDKGRVGLAPHLALFDFLHGQRLILDTDDSALRIVLRLQVELVEPVAGQMRQPRQERRAARRVQPRRDAPIFLWLEFIDLQLALADQTQRDRLHPSRRARAGQLTPQHRRNIEADQIIERAARQIGLDQRRVDVAPVGERLLHRFLGDLIKGDAGQRLAFEQPALGQQFLDVPGNRLALAIRIGREENIFSALQGALDLANRLAGALADLPGHGEILVRPHRPILWRQVADMAVRRQYLVLRPQILINSLGLGRRLDDDEVGGAHCAGSDMGKDFRQQ